MKILLTGAAGFIASWLQPELEERGHQVLGTDIEWGDDLLMFNTAWTVVHEAKADLVVHLAAQPGRVFGQGVPDATIRLNTSMTANVARACAAAGTRLCYVSTSEVYGPLYQPMPGPDELIWEEPQEFRGLEHPNNLYGLTKLWGEQVSRLYAPADLLIIRPSMPYGPNMPVGTGRAALPTMLWRALRGEPFQVHDGASRSWCWIGDAVRGMADVIERGSGTYNVGRDDDTRTILECAQVAYDMVGTDQSLIEVVGPPEMVSMHKELSMARLRALGWKPEVSLLDGMAMVLEELRRKEGLV